MLKKPRLGRKIVLTAALAFAGCHSHPPRQATVSQAPSAAAQSSPLSAANYRIDPARSEIRLLVYRAGPLAHLGHNHVIVNRRVSGTVHVASDAAPGDLRVASFAMVIPVAEFIVDDAQARSEEGEEFSADVSDEAKVGTLHNMLSAELLNAAGFPTITVASMNTAADRDEVVSQLAVDVAGHTSMIAVPFLLQSNGVLTATGRVTLRQSDLGLVPFRALLGAITVQDEFTVKFNVVAVPQ